MNSKHTEIKVLSLNEEMEAVIVTLEEALKNKNIELFKDCHLKCDQLVIELADLIPKIKDNNPFVTELNSFVADYKVLSKSLNEQYVRG